MLTCMVIVFLTSIVTSAASVCGGYFTSSSGMISSPNYPSFYPKSQDCIYNIRVSSGLNIVLTFLFFQLESSCCSYDYLEVRDGCFPTSPLVAKYCGEGRLPAKLRSSGSCLYLRFVTDISSQKTGFYLMYDTTGSLGNQVLRTCPSGYSIIGELNSTCSSGIWICRADCLNLQRPIHGYLSSTVVKHGSSVTVSCYSGYTLSGERTLVCTSGSLSGRIGTCEAGCANLQRPTNGSLSSTVVKHGSSITVSCNSGYTLSGERTLVCLSGSLSGRIGTCESDCVNLRRPTHGYLSSTIVKHGSSVTVSCNSGYTLSGERTLICSSGTLSRRIGTCESDCSGMVAPANGSLSNTHVTHGEHIVVFCDSDYTLSGEKVLFCTSGFLSGNIGSCQADCVDLRRPTNGNLTSSAIAHGSSVTVSCNLGYTLSGDHTLKCFSGSLSGEIGKCEKDCVNLVKPTNGNLPSISVEHGSSVTVSCYPGYSLLGQRTLVCSSGSLLGSIGTCEADCSGLIGPGNGSLSATYVTHGNYVTIYCDSGFTLSGERTLVCSSGALSEDIGNCQADCTGLIGPEHGFLSYTNVQHGSFISVSCHDGYTLVGDRTLQCLSGTLAGNIGTCYSDCLGLVAPEHGFLSGTNVSHADFVSYSCQKGYTLVGDRILRCLSGSLAGNIGTCYADCLGLVAPEHGFLSDTNVSHAAFVSVSCQDGYTYAGDSTLRCFSGSLVGDIGTCYADCNGIASPANGLLSSTNVTHGNFVIVSCDTGYQLEGTQTLVCLFGSLQGHIGTCVADNARTNALVATTNNTGKSTIIAVAVSSAIIIIALSGNIVSQRLFFKRTKRQDHGTIRMSEIQDPGMNSQNPYSEIRSSTVNGKLTEGFAATGNLDPPPIPSRSNQRCEADKLEEEKYTNLATTAKMKLNDLGEYEQLKNLERYSVAQQPMQEDDEPENTYVNLQLRR